MQLDEPQHGFAHSHQVYGSWSKFFLPDRSVHTAVHMVVHNSTYNCGAPRGGRCWCSKIFYPDAPGTETLMTPRMMQMTTMRTNKRSLMHAEAVILG